MITAVIFASLAVIILIVVKICRYSTMTKSWNDAIFLVILIGIQILLENEWNFPQLPLIIGLIIIYMYAVISTVNFIRMGRKEINMNSIREAFDNLPSGICFFNEAGMPVLCNRVMYDLAYEITEGKYLKSIKELSMLEKKSTVALRNGEVWRFINQTIEDDEGKPYFEVVATNITEMYTKSTELKAGNEKLQEMFSHMNRLVKNVADIAREEEMLSMKMKMHDDIGGCVLILRRLLKQAKAMNHAEPAIQRWQNVVSMIQRDNEYVKAEIDRFEQLRISAEGIGVDIKVKGRLPESQRSLYLIITAIRECVTNTFKHAEGNEVYIDVAHNDIHGKRKCQMEITNNGKPPQGIISEGVGLSGLRQRIERAGGTMEIVSDPEFKMTVIIPEEAEEE